MKKVYLLFCGYLFYSNCVSCMLSIRSDRFNNIVSKNFSNALDIAKLKKDLGSQKKSLDEAIFGKNDASVKEIDKMSFLSMHYSRVITLLDDIEKYQKEKNEKNKIKCENQRTLNRKKCVNIET